MNKSAPFLQQAGSVLAFVLLALVTLGVLATLAYGAYFQIARGTQDTVMRAQASALLTQAVQILATEALDTDGDAYVEATAGSVVLGDGWAVPATSGAGKSDPWGTALKYCVWDNGVTNSSSGRLNGDNPANPASIQLAVVSAGPDRKFDTSCLQAKAGTAQGDDGVRNLTVGQLTQAAGLLYYGDPVTTVSALPASDQPIGKIRIVLDTRVAYQWTGSAWTPLVAVAVPGVTAGASCTAYPLGALGYDATKDHLQICKSTGLWGRVQ